MSHRAGYDVIHRGVAFDASGEVCTCGPCLATVRQLLFNFDDALKAIEDIKFVATVNDKDIHRSDKLGIRPNPNEWAKP